MKRAILLSGFKSSGKDTVADLLMQAHPNESIARYAYADKIKAVCSTVFNVPYEVMDGKNPEARQQREELIPFWSDYVEGLTSRKALTTIGTDLFRDHFLNEIWALSTIKNIIDDNPETAIVTDLREPVEESMTRSHLSSHGYKVISIRIERQRPTWLPLAIDAWYNQSEKAIAELNALGVHRSEWCQVGLQPNYHINNDRADYRTRLQEQLDVIL